MISNSTPGCRLHMQQRAITEYLCEHGTPTGSEKLGSFPPCQWLLSQDTCTVVSPFEEATRMLNRDTVPVVFLLEHTLWNCGQGTQG